MEIDDSNYTIEDIAKKLKKFIFEDHYLKEFSNIKDSEKPGIGFIVAGYSSNSSFAEEWRIDMFKGRCE